MFSSLRTKLTLSMLITSLAAISVMALISPLLLEQRFEDLTRQEQLGQLTQLLKRLKQQQTNWGTADGAQQLFQHMQEQALLPTVPLDNEPQLLQLFNIRQTLADYAVTDHNGYVLSGAGQYDAGEQLPAPIIKRALPLKDNDELLGYALNTGATHLNSDDGTYLLTLSQSMLIGAAAGLLITLLLSLTMGRKLITNLRHLTQAAMEMSKGNLDQQVSIKGDDEVAILAREFNRMCQELQNTYAELTASNETIRAQAEAMQELSLRDELTGLHNRRYFNQQFRLMHHQAMRYKDPMTLALGDIDHFKLINDRFSHQIGDAVLKQLAKIMQKEVRESDVLARYGGEEFVLLMPQTTGEQAERLLNRIRAEVESYAWESICQGLNVTISFGISDQLQKDMGHSMLVEADNKLYQAKDEGRNRVCV
ncbi:sensor domain-containing diguanylate cyclase [Lacimicrobium sp. SS2-24]|uniref:sensor domain-containing diguanylate cyclase n=1 Tax=Lacimicrobium sp. SS2-24 TaxID=2005569 RepID=UPI0011329A4A|nr:sensor domain-containing diguanylate cyclase [Lacimicrobium sp. SS2-24]